MSFFSSSVDRLKHDSLFVVSRESLFCFPNSLVVFISSLTIKKYFWMCSFSFFFVGSAQLILSGTSIIEKNDCNETVVLPCHVNNLIQNNENDMFVTWTRQGVIIFSYHGGTKKVNTHPLFSSARLLSPPELVKGVASLVLDSAQATVGNYSCKVTESNREGKIRMQLITSSGELPAIASEPFGRGKQTKS